MPIAFSFTSLTRSASTIVSCRGVPAPERTALWSVGSTGAGTPSATGIFAKDGRELRSGADAGLPVDRAKVFLDRLRQQEQLRRRLLVCRPSDDCEGNLQLLGGEL